VRFIFLFKPPEIRYIDTKSEKGGVSVNEKETIAALEEENRRLRKDNDMLREIMVQMRGTLNRLIIRYVLPGTESR